MLGGKIEAIIVFFPLMELEQVHQLKFGEIGPATLLLNKYPLLEKIYPSLTRTVVDKENIKEPVIAIAITDHSKLVNELECIGFLAASEPMHMAEDEILSQRTVFTIHQEDHEDAICVNQHALISPIESIQFIQLQDFPKVFVRWDSERISKFEMFLSSALQSDLYKALVTCLSDTQDKEARRERARIIISVTLFNEAFIRLSYTNPFSKHEIVLMAGAFEALLNLPSEALRSSFANALMTLVGIRTTVLKRWCEEFYDLRSGLAHGDTTWGKEELVFNLAGNEQLDHSVIARHLFVHCLKTKLFLSGLLKNYDRSNLGSELIGNVLGNIDGT